MNIVELNIHDLVPYENNPRNNIEAVEYVANSIEKFGFKVPIVVDTNNVIVAGHTRYMASKKLGLETVPCIVADDLTEEQIKAFRLADNKVSEIATWDDELLAIELSDIVDIDMGDFGFLDIELDDIIEIEEDEGVEEVKTAKFIQSGDVIYLGNHRLMCGDSTNIEDVEKLMNGELADMCITDPPYNVNYEGRTGDKLKIENDSMEDEAFRAFLTKAFYNVNVSLKNGGVFYVWLASLEAYNFMGALRDAGLQLREVLVWNKSSMTLGRFDYHWKHEPCLYGWKDGGAHYWGSDRKQTTVIDFDKPSRNGDHPTMKPVGLFAYQIQNSSRPNEIVLDLFGGSGTTLIACEEIGRKARLMELSPEYCEVIIKRWCKLTDRNIKILRDGEYIEMESKEWQTENEGDR